jgi:hypothetical protein
MSIQIIGNINMLGTYYCGIGTEGAFARVAEAGSARPSRPGQPEHGCNGAMSHVCPPGPI